MEGNALVLVDVTREKLQLVADITAKSVSPAHHEKERGGNRAAVSSGSNPSPAISTTGAAAGTGS
jgi:hypothetical protein